jgi:AcrR family transcriptional regulator
LKRTSEEAEATRLNILEAAARVFTSTSFNASRLEDIAREAGVTRGAIYWHFDNKQDLFRNLMQLRMGNITKYLSEIYLSELRPAEKLRRLLLESLRSLETDSNYRNGIRLAMSISSQDQQLESMQIRMQQHIRMMMAHLESLLQECKRDGDLLPDVNVALAGGAIVAWYDGIAGLWLRTVGQPSFSMTRDAQELVKMMLRGILIEHN